MSINKQLDQLFDDWKEKSKNNKDAGNKLGSEHFVKDGIVCKPTFVENLWLNSNKRVLFLLKDQNQGADSSKHWDDDARCWFNTEGVYNLQIPFFKNLAYCLYAIFNPDETFESIKQENLVAFWNKTPFAYVEAKKQPGKKSIAARVLQQYLNEYKEFLIKEISILNPDVIVNCCGDPVGWDFVNNEFFNNSPNKHCYKNTFDSKNRDTVIYYEDVKKLHIMLPHPSTQGIAKNPKYFFDFSLFPYKEFLKAYPDWLNQNATVNNAETVK
jgi:hypothetical protein